MSAEEEQAAMMSVSYRGVAESLGSVRFDAERWLADRGIMGLSSFDCLLVLSELSTNALQAAPGEQFEVHLTLAEIGASAKLVLAVTNCSARSVNEIPGSDDWSFPDNSEPTGRGLAIVRALADEAVVRSEGNRLTVAASMTVPLG